jgi:type VI secretion system protein ImpH
MAAEDRRTDPSLREILLSRAYEFEFFQAVRLLGRILRDRQPVGGTARPADEMVRFGTQLTLDFPPSAVHEIEGFRDGCPRLIAAFFGLTGTQGVLPHHYTEYLMEWDARRDRGMADFLDIFNHRLLSFFYRAWEKHCVYVTYERAAIAARADPFAQHLYDLIGMGTAGLRGRLPVRDESLLFYGGLIAQRPHSASALRGILRDYFGVPVEIEQCLGNWYALHKPERSYMDRDGRHNQLGDGAVAGDEVWDQQARFRVRIGPLSFARFRGFLPGSPALGVLVEWVRFFVGPALSFEVNLVLQKEEVPSSRLDDTAVDGARLGWVSWVKTEEMDRNVSDVEFTYIS